MFRRRQPADPDAFGARCLGYLEPLYATAMRLTRNRADAEDLVQDTIVKALRFSDRFERGTNLRAWLYTILHNTWRNRLRDPAREAAASTWTATRSKSSRRAPTGRPRVRHRSSCCSGARWTRTCARRSTSCRTMFRQAVWLRDVEEFSYAEIAKMLDVPIGTVMSRISRGRRMLFEKLSQAKTEARSRVA